MPDDDGPKPSSLSVGLEPSEAIVLGGGGHVVNACSGVLDRAPDRVAGSALTSATRPFAMSASPRRITAKLNAQATEPATGRGRAAFKLPELAC